MFVVHDTSLNQRKMKNNTMPTCKISYFLIKIMVFSQKKKFTMHLLIKKCQNTFFEWIFKQIF
jgi:hypothetical protein